MTIRWRGPLKYKTLADLKAAYDSGELSRGCWMTLDNDTTPVYLRPDEEDMGECVFDGGSPEQLLEQALTLLGIPWESA